MTNPPPRLHKKGSALGTNTRKIESILYELALSKMAGFAVHSSISLDMGGDGKTEDNNDDL